MIRIKISKLPDLFLEDFRKMGLALITAGSIGYFFEKPHYFKILFTGFIWWAISLLVSGLVLVAPDEKG